MLAKLEVLEGVSVVDDRVRVLAELEVLDEGHSSESLWGEVGRRVDIEVISASTEAHRQLKCQRRTGKCRIEQEPDHQVSHT